MSLCVQTISSGISLLAKEEPDTVKTIGSQIHFEGESKANYTAVFNDCLYIVSMTGLTRAR